MSLRKTKIDWPNLDYLWNPIVGCTRGCEYCVVRNRVWPRVRHLYGNNDFNVVTELPEQLDRLKTVKKPSTFFVGFYTDIEYCSMKYMNHILYTLAQYPQHTFLFLTKEPLSYQGFEWPDNTRQGITITGAEDLERQRYKILYAMDLPRPFFSIEPLLGSIRIQIPFKVDLVIVGAQTGKGAVAPHKDWIKSITDHCMPERVYWKRNIKSYL